LRQVACDPSILGKEVRNLIQHHSNAEEFESNKLEFLLDKVKVLLRAGHKMILFSQFIALLKNFRNRLDQNDIPYEYLDGQTTERNLVIERFQKYSDIQILLAGIKTGGLGLNLTSADYCFILDPGWNPAVEQQAVDRIHRIGQDKKVFVYRILSQDSVEEKMIQLHEHKRQIAQNLITADHTFLNQLNFEDFQNLFR
jgi:SNF2 family DNA or RNA helicase